MWLDLKRKLFSGLCIGSLLLVGVAGPLQAEQYRSKLLLNPSQALSEDAAVSIEQLEGRFNSIKQQYGRSSAGMQLARHYVQQGDYEKAIAYYQAALEAQGLSELVNRDLRREMAETYLAMAAPEQALQVLAVLGEPAQLSDPLTLLLYARIQYALNDYLSVAVTLERLYGLVEPVQEDLYQQMVALAYGIQAYELCTRLLDKLLQQHSDQPDYWLQMVSVLLKQNLQQRALAYLTLARSQAQLQGREFDEQNLLLLSSLHAAQGDPYQGAALLEQALASGTVSPSATNYRRLFDYWLQARETKSALLALQQAAVLSRDGELYLYWAQLLMGQQEWQQMRQVVLDLCAKPVTATILGRAYLMLGISDYRLGRPQAAYDAFANATLVGGANELAGQWLQRLESEGIKGDIPARPSGACRLAGG